MTFTEVVVTRTYRAADGRPASGSVLFTPSSVMVNGDTVIEAPVTAALASSGIMSITLVANTDSATSPVGVAYLVEERLTGQPTRRYAVIVPHDQGGTVDLATLTTLVAPTYQPPTFALADATDVASTAPTTGQALVWTGTTWAPGDVAGGTGTLPATMLNRVAQTSSGYPARPSTGYVDWLGTTDPGAGLLWGDTWTQIPVSAPNAPTIGTATGGNAQASVAFTAPSWNGGATITGYTATSTPGGLTASGSSSPLTVTGLTNGTSYTFKVKATNATGTGPESAASNSVAPAGAGATVPGAPTIGTATAGDASASVAFTPPGSNGGSAITSYTATSTPGSVTGTGSSSPITVSGLTNGTSYTFKVKATNGVGTGAESAASNSVTPAVGASGAVRFDASGDFLTRSETGPDPASTGLTVTLWAYLSVDRDVESTILRYGGAAGGTTSASIALSSSDGTTLAVFTPAGTITTGASLTVGIWCRIAYTLTTAGSGTIYVHPAGGSLASNTASGTTTQRDVISIGGRPDDGAAWFNGRMAHTRVWSAVLNQTEIQAEWASTTPVRTSGLWASWPLTNASTLTDQSGNARTLTAGSTSVTTEAGPI